MSRIVFTIISILLLHFATVRIKAASGVVTIVNPVRISTYNPDPVASIKAQYAVVRGFDFPATWLVTYDVLNDPAIVAVLKKFDDRQEIGLFLEVTANSAKAAGIDYHQTGSWHFANAVLLSGYTQEERIMFLDAIFAKYKSIFGYYPAAVGSWWTDSFSLNYVNQKYGVSIDLGCSDQFSTDNYSLWGQPWSVAFQSTIRHSGLPHEKGIIRLQWAPREPGRGYFDSLFSTQDYFTQPGLKIDFFEKLIGVYATKANGQITIGLEGDLPPSMYGDQFRSQLQLVKDKKLTVMTMNDFGKKFEKMDGKVIDTNAQWYQTGTYRLGIIGDKIVDLRRYMDYTEPYYERPNRERTLYINLPAVFDSKSDPDSVWDIGQAQVRSYEDFFDIDFPKTSIPQVLYDSPYFRVKTTASGYRIFTKTIKLEDQILTDWSIETLHAFKSVRFWLRLFKGQGFGQFKKERYLISADEQIALIYLKSKPRGLVLVADRECLQCEYHSSARPAVYANLRDYVSRYSAKQVVRNEQVFLTDKDIAREALVKSSARYVYLTKYESYIETLPLSPGDLGVRKIFENANAVIWEVVK